MEWFSTIGLIVLGIGLVILEIIFVPGTTIVGILGIIFFIGGIYLGFDYFDSDTGWAILISSVIAGGVALVYAFKSNAWERFSLKNTSEGKVNEGTSLKVSVGDKGLSISTLKPFGKAEFNNEEFEVRSNGSYINAGQHIEIKRIDGINIFVETYNVK